MDKVLLEILYTSELRDEVPAAEVGRLVEHARRRNAEHGITGALLFDGAQFCQVLEGPENAVARLMRRIEADQRHRQVRRVHEAETDVRGFRSWYLGYVQVDDLGAIGRIATLTAADAMAAFHDLLPRIDFGLDGDPSRDSPRLSKRRGAGDDRQA